MLRIRIKSTKKNRFNTKFINGKKLLSNKKHLNSKISYKKLFYSEVDDLTFNSIDKYMNRLNNYYGVKKTIINSFPYYRNDKYNTFINIKKYNSLNENKKIFNDKLHNTLQDIFTRISKSDQINLDNINSKNIVKSSNTSNFDNQKNVFNSNIYKASRNHISKNKNYQYNTDINISNTNNNINKNLHNNIKNNNIKNNKNNTISKTESNQLLNSVLNVFTDMVSKQQLTHSNIKNENKNINNDDKINNFKVHKLNTNTNTNTNINKLSKKNNNNFNHNIIKRHYTINNVVLEKKNILSKTPPHKFHKLSRKNMLNSNIKNISKSNLRYKFYKHRFIRGSYLHRLNELFNKFKYKGKKKKIHKYVPFKKRKNHILIDPVLNINDCIINYKKKLNKNFFFARNLLDNDYGIYVFSLRKMVFNRIYNFF